MENYLWDYRNTYEWMKRVSKSSLPPLIICCASTGGMHGKEANANLPETPEEQVTQIEAAYKAGAAMVHVHARDPQCWYRCSGDAEQYKLINAMIREKCPEIIINNTTGGALGMSPEECLCVLDASPEIASLNLGPDMVKTTLKERKAPLPHPRPALPIEGCFPNDYDTVSMFASRMRERGVKPEIELYHPGLYWVVEYLLARKLIEPPYLFQFVMGFQTCSYPTPSNLLSFVNELPLNSIFEVAGIGPFQMPMIAMSIILGGHVRVGMEDSVYYKRGRLLKDNAEAVKRVVRLASDLNREIATPQQAREILGLSLKPRKP